MDKQRMEMILPAQQNRINNRRKGKPQIILTDLVQVNPIDSRNLKSNKISCPPYPPIKNKNIKYEHQKQEQFYKLNRENKIRQNNEWKELLEPRNEILDNKQSFPKLKPINSMKNKLQETNKDIEESTVQLDQISTYIQAKKNQLSHVDNNIGLKTSSTVSIPNSKMNTSKSCRPHTNSNLKHLCTKNIYNEKIKNVDSMIKFIDKHMEYEQESKKKGLSQKGKNTLQIKKLNETLGLVSAKLNRVKDKYFTNDYETNHFTSVINKRPKYRSVKDLLKSNSPVLSSMEASKIMQADLENDLNNLSQNDKLLCPPKNNQIEVLFEHVDVIKKGSFQDDLDDDSRTDYSKLVQTPALSPKLIDEDARKHLNTAPHQLSPLEGKKKITRRAVTVDTQTPIPNKLERSILKSDYLMKEFGIDTNTKYSVPPSDDKVQVSTESRKWTKDLEYFMR